MWSLARRSISTSACLQVFRGTGAVARVKRRRPQREEGVSMEKYHKMKVHNPGVDRRLAALKDEGVSLDDLDTNIDDSEADFVQLHKSYDDFRKDKLAQKELVSSKIVGKKYFNEHIPNYLTWSEKEHIRKLHETDPAHWTTQKLTESFPITPNGVSKLLKVNWNPDSQSRIDRHDSSVLRNWKELKEGDVEGVSLELRKHILKFTDRVVVPQQDSLVNNKVDVSSKGTKLGEYARLVSKYQTEGHQLEVSREKRTRGISRESVTKSIMPTSKETNRSKSITTLDNLREEISKNIDTSREVAPVDKLIVHSAPDHLTSTASHQGRQLDIDSDQLVKAVAPAQRQVQRANVKEPQQSYPNRIRIPKKSLKVGATYKVKDCYYDWDGKLLYRVPGLE